MILQKQGKAQPPQSNNSTTPSQPANSQRRHNFNQDHTHSIPQFMQEQLKDKEIASARNKTPLQ
jgi:hypothetical protein